MEYIYSQVDRLIHATIYKKLNIKNFHDQSEFTNRLYNQMKDKNLIGMGGVGKVYLVENGKYVIKQASPCYRTGSALQQYCDDLKLSILNNEFLLIPSGDNKVRYILPNLLSEVLIGVFMTDLVNKLDSINFSRTISSLIIMDKNNMPSVYLVLDAHKKIIQRILNNKTNKWENIIDPEMEMNTPREFMLLLFQTAHAILQAQEKYKFTHYDLHIHNILWDEWPEDKKFISYPIPNRNDELKRIMIPKSVCKFIVKITDYGLSRMETNSVLITSKLDKFPEFTFGEFNTSYDFISFIGTTIMDTNTRGPFSQIFSDIHFFKYFLEFVLWVLKDNTIKIPDNPSLNQLQAIQKVLAEKYWSIRPNGVYFRPKNVDQKFVSYYDTRNMVEIVNNLAESLSYENLVVPHRASKEVIIINRLAERYTIYPSPQTFSIGNSVLEYPTPGNLTDAYVEKPLEPNSIVVRNFKLLYNGLPTHYNFTFTDKQLSECPVQEHFITEIYVDRIRSKLDGYKFKSECCKLDPVNYMRQNNIFGFAINGGFFDINNDYLPIGPYRDTNLNGTYHSIPEKYKDVYRYVVIDSFGDLYITDNPSKFPYVFASGPILINNGEIVFNPYDKRFACDTAPNIKSKPGIRLLGENKDTVTVSGLYKYDYSKDFKSCRYVVENKTNTFPKCDNINPGELSHSDNPNPRSVLGITSDQNYVFITVEGRANRGVGMDLYTLSNIIKLKYPDLLFVINLDGGRSSNVAWRSPLNPGVVAIGNPKHLYQYPVGNILTFTK